MKESRVIIDFNPGCRNYVAHSPHHNLVAAAERAPDVLPPPALGEALPPDAVVLRDRPRPAYAGPGATTIFVGDDIHSWGEERWRASIQELAAFETVASPYRHAKLPGGILHSPSQLHWVAHIPASDRRHWVAMPHSVPVAPPLPREASESTRGFAVAPSNRMVYPSLFDVRGIGLPSAVWQTHPGYCDAIAMRAAKDAWWPTLASHQIGIVGLAWGPGGYVLAKYVEYLYAGLLLLAERPGPEDCELLGLRHMENCILFDWPREKGFFVATYERAIRDFTPFAPIAAAGQRLALRRHTARSRLDYLRRVAAHFRDFGRVPDHDQQLAFMATCELS